MEEITILGKKMEETISRKKAKIPKVFACRSRFVFQNINTGEAEKLVMYLNRLDLDLIEKMGYTHYQHCYSCGASIFSNKRITGCPICHKSFYD